MSSVSGVTSRLQTQIRSHILQTTGPNPFNRPRATRLLRDWLHGIADVCQLDSVTIMQVGGYEVATEMAEVK